MRTFSLKDDCTLSGVRVHPDDRRVVGGGYVDPMGGDRLISAHGFVELLPEGMKNDEKLVPLDYNRSS